MLCLVDADDDDDARRADITMFMPETKLKYKCDKLTSLSSGQIRKINVREKSVAICQKTCCSGSDAYMRSLS